MNTDLNTGSRGDGSDVLAGSFLDLIACGIGYPKFLVNFPSWEYSTSKTAQLKFFTSF